MAGMFGGSNQGINFDPGRVLLGKPGNKPYLSTNSGQGNSPTPANPSSMGPPSSSNAPNFLGPPTPAPGGQNLIGPPTPSGQGGSQNLIGPPIPIDPTGNAGNSGVQDVKRLPPNFTGPPNPGGGDPALQGNANPAQLAVSTYLSPESIRVSGAGPFDQSYRQNLATFAGGQFSRPSTGMSFNPTGKLEDLLGQPTGAGTAPVLGMPASLLQMALGGQPFAWQQPIQPSASNTNQTMLGDVGGAGDWRSWLDQLRGNASGFGINL